MEGKRKRRFRVPRERFCEFIELYNGQAQPGLEVNEETGGAEFRSGLTPFYDPVFFLRESSSRVQRSRTTRY